MSTFVVGLGILSMCEVVGPSWPLYVLINTVLHFAVDFYSSKATKYYSGNSDWHNFFVIIGLDQLIHQFCLISTIFLLS